MSGQGPGVILVHGLLWDHRAFADLAGSGRAGGMKIALTDLRGHGRSSRSPHPTTLDDLVDDVLAVMDAVSDAPLVVVGLGLGATLALGAALRAPDRIAALGLWGADAAAMGPLEASGWGSMTQASRTWSTRASSRIAWPLHTTWGTRNHRAAQHAELDRVAMTLSARALGDLVEAWRGRPDWRPRLSEIAVPVSVLWGEQDRLVRPRAGPELLEGLPKAFGGAVRNAAHHFQLDAPDVAQAALTELVARAEG